jgi:long-chain acyl-CoA synthetase
MTNQPEFWEVLFGAWHAGMVAVPINPKLHSREIEFILAHSGACLCFISPDLSSSISPLTTELVSLHEVISTDDPKYQEIKSEPAPSLKPADVLPGDTAWIFYTSGTTGRPKGAMLSHRSLLMMILSHCTDVDQPGPEDCIIHAAPQSHGSGMCGLVHFAKGANNIVPDSHGFDADEMADLLDHYQGVSLFAAPTMINRLISSPSFIKANLSHLRTIVYGGAPMYQADIKRALDILGPCLSQIYGQGESPMTITSLSKAAHIDVDHPRYQERLASVGVARTGVEVKIVDQEGNDLEIGQVGEVIVRGDILMTRYWYDDQATEATLSGGWLRTGDIGSMDQDGFLTLLDRSKDMVISGGMNIYPREIEELLLVHPQVKETSVVGRPHPEWGEEVVAFVVSDGNGDLTEKQLDELCLANIARFKRPKAYIFVDALPKNSTGKVLKNALRDLAKTMISEASSPKA